MKRYFLTITAVATVWLSGCSGEEVIYPQAPPSYPMYDTSTIDNEQGWNISNVHDPSIIKEGDTYYIFSTDVKVGGKAKPGLMVRKSKDLMNWEWAGYALDGVPAEAKAWTGAKGMWAPEVAKLGDRFYLYYSASTFGSNRSFIGVATSDSLEGPWTDQGEVVKTGPGDEPNAIDPNIVKDAEGKPWFVYGSFFGGIYVSPLDPATGKLTEQGYGTKIAARAASESGAVEGPYMIYNAELKQYYLFVSYDSLSQDYNVRVGRSASITGPFLDSLGRDMLDTAYDPSFDVGNKLMGGYRFAEGEGWIAPGHNSILQDGDSDYIVHHARPEQDPNWMYLHVRKLLWTDDGWPVVSPERYAGEQVQTIPKAALAGTWERIAHEKYIDGPIDSEAIELRKDGKIGAKDSADYWEFDGEHTVRLYFQEDDQTNAVVETVLVLPAWDSELNKSTLVFTGMDDKGLAVWGKKIK
ncbi:arabinan endo-1,5-alpha-L-arabinosidase [Paenibacillus algorifonticola]|uniref:Arabinan endo-1,5-alpha-L-arabinosidase n=1 Tax=Paenibacillus algorifonticola TaxID=684063 RepID=A0A1I2CTM5_9BACL|nr:arabinan endo-1,5-alpha-L-arabinosidase [Paenibacillus algorifonticola]